MATTQDVKFSDYVAGLQNSNNLRGKLPGFIDGAGVAINGEKIASSDEVIFKEYVVDVSKIAPCGGTIRSSDNKWLASTVWYGGLVNVENFRGLYMEMKANDAASDFTFLKEGFSAGQAAVFASGCNSVFTTHDGGTNTVKVPEDAVYLYVYLSSNGTSYRPKSIKFTNGAFDESDLKRELGYKSVNIDKLKSCGFTILSSNGDWKASTTYYGTLIDVSRINGAKVKISTRYDKSCDFTFVKTAPIEGVNPDYANGYNGVQNIEASDSRTLTVPNNAKLLYIYMNGNGVNYLPIAIEMPDNGEDIFYNDRGNVSAASEYRAEGRNNVRICAWNIGHFSNGSNKVSEITPTDYAAKLTQFRNFIYKNAKSVILGLSEYSFIFGRSDAGKQKARERLFFDFGNFNEFEQRNYSCNAIYSDTLASNYRLHDFNCLKNETIGHTTVIKAQDYYYADCDFYIKGQRVKFVIVHLAFDETRPGVLTKKQIDELAQVFANEERCIICGDFNTEDMTEFLNLDNAGFSRVNNGSYKTYRASSLALDNICVKGLTVSGVEMLNADGLSDHNPLICTVSVESDMNKIIEVPAPPSNGNYKLVSRNGVTSWEAM